MAYRKLFAFGELLEITREARVHGKILIVSRNRAGGVSAWMGKMLILLLFFIQVKSFSSRYHSFLLVLKHRKRAHF